jgi:hypothetical protein
LPFQKLLRALSTDERNELKASAEALGIHHAILVYDSDEYGPDCVIDGGHRLAIAAELKLDVLIQRLPVDDETAAEMAIDLNECRRQLTLEELSEERRKRIVQVAALRAEGNSTRAIAAAVGKSQSQVIADLKKATEQGCSVEPERVKCLDNKTRTAKPKKSKHKYAHIEQTNGIESPPHPNAELMHRVTSLTTDLTRAINRADDAGRKLLRATTLCGLVDYQQGSIECGIETQRTPRFLPLLGIHALLELAGRPGPLPSDMRIRLIYARANGTWIPPLTAMRRAEKKKHRQK